jgi:hypothetical protein
MRIEIVVEVFGGGPLDGLPAAVRTLALGAAAFGSTALGPAAVGALRRAGLLARRVGFRCGLIYVATGFTATVVFAPRLFAASFVLSRLVTS